MTELRVRTARPKPQARPLTLAEKIEAAIDRLYELLPDARNERRSHGTTENVIDGVMQVGVGLQRAARGGA